MWKYRKTVKYLFLAAFIMISTQIAAAPRIINFGGYDWIVRSSNAKSAPGPNLFSNSDEVVWVDDSGYLNISIQNEQGRWLCSELTSREKMGYGTYTIILQGRIDLLDPQTVFGFFT